MKCEDLVYPDLKVYVLLHELWLQTYMFEKLFMVIELLIEVVVVKNYMDPLLKLIHLLKTFLPYFLK